MKIKKTKFEGLLVIELEIFNDNRGFFCERFNQKKWRELGIEYEFIQDNHSRSKPNVLRGMHAQINPFQAKLVGVTCGSIIDYIVDIRNDSKTYLESFSIELSEFNGKLLMIPEGFLHGFYVNSDKDTDVLYKVDGIYNVNGEISVKWNDPTLNIDWPKQNFIISDKDNNAKSYHEFLKSKE